MRYENRQPPEGINITRVNPYTQFFKLLLAAMLFLVIVVVVLQFLGGFMAKRVPFTYEKQISDKLGIDLNSASASSEMIRYLNELAIRVSPGMHLGEAVAVDVHYNSENVFNAFATMGGNLVFYRGLLKEIPHENALAMVMAHEIAHINHRDPMAALGGGVTSMIFTSFITGSSGLAERFLNKATSLTSMQFTRSMESAADAAALRGVNALYGHVNGAADLFEVMGDFTDDSNRNPNILERFATTHPLRDDRIDAIVSLAKDNEWKLDGKLTPLPAEFWQWLNVDD